MTLVSDRKEYKREWNRRWRAANPEKARIQNRDAARRWRAAHLEKARIKNRKTAQIWRAANPEKHREQVRKWRVENPEKVQKVRQRRMRFKDQTIMLAENPRKGLCTDCGATGKLTNIHHVKYDPADPLAHTIELCRSCHTKRHVAKGTRGIVG